MHAVLLSLPSKVRPPLVLDYSEEDSAASAC